MNFVFKFDSPFKAFILLCCQENLALF